MNWVGIDGFVESGTRVIRYVYPTVRIMDFLWIRDMFRDGLIALRIFPFGSVFPWFGRTDSRVIGEFYYFWFCYWGWQTLALCPVLILCFHIVILAPDWLYFDSVWSSRIVCLTDDRWGCTRIQCYSHIVIGIVRVTIYCLGSAPSWCPLPLLIDTDLLVLCLTTIDRDPLAMGFLLMLYTVV